MDITDRFEVVSLLLCLDKLCQRNPKEVSQ